jgi:hypothetical protein
MLAATPDSGFLGVQWMKKPSLHQSSTTLNKLLSHLLWKK